VHTPPAPPIATPFAPAGKGLKTGLGFTNYIPFLRGAEDGDLLGVGSTDGHCSFA
jgi:hypothetical protein